MDEKTNFALTIILSFVLGILLGVGDRVVAESNGREARVGDNQLIDLLLMIFFLMALGYILAIVWHIRLLSFVFVVIIASVLFGANYGSKMALDRNQAIVRVFLACLGIGAPLMFHYVL